MRACKSLALLHHAHQLSVSLCNSRTHTHKATMHLRLLVGAVAALGRFSLTCKRLDALASKG